MQHGIIVSGKSGRRAAPEGIMIRNGRSGFLPFIAGGGKHYSLSACLGKSRLFLLALFIGALACLSGAALAGEGDVDKLYSSGQIKGCGGSSSKGCDIADFLYNAGGASSYNVNKLVRKNTKVSNLKWNYTAPSRTPGSGGSQGTWSVIGEYSCASDKSWNYTSTSGSLCWGAITLESDRNCKGAYNSTSFPATYAGNVVSSGNGCSTGACVVDYQPASSSHFITADTDDNMMAILPYSSATKGFLVFNDCGGVPYWLERTSSGHSDKYLMIPTMCKDYNTFIGAKPSAVKIEDACHPATLSICPPAPSRPAMPPHPGCGGHAHGSSWCVKSHVETVCDAKKKCTSITVCDKSNWCDCGTVR